MMIETGTAVDVVMAGMVADMVMVVVMMGMVTDMVMVVVMMGMVITGRMTADVMTTTTKVAVMVQVMVVLAVAATPQYNVRRKVTGLVMLQLRRVRVAVRAAVRAAAVR